MLLAAATPWYGRVKSVTDTANAKPDGLGAVFIAKSGAAWSWMVATDATNKTIANRVKRVLLIGSKTSLDNRDSMVMA